MGKKYKYTEVDPKERMVSEPALEYGIENSTTSLHIPSIEEVKSKLAKSEEDLAKGIYTTHEDMKKRHL